MFASSTPPWEKGERLCIDIAVYVVPGVDRKFGIKMSTCCLVNTRHKS